MNKMKIFTTLFVLWGLLFVFPQQNHAQNNGIFSRIFKSGSANSSGARLKGLSSKTTLENGYCKDEPDDTIRIVDYPDDIESIKWEVFTKNSDDEEVAHDDWFDPITASNGIDSTMVFYIRNVTSEYYNDFIIYIRYTYTNSSGFSTSVEDGTYVFDLPVYDLTPAEASMCGGDSTTLTLSNSDTTVLYYLIETSATPDDTIKVYNGNDNRPLDMKVGQEGTFIVRAKSVNDIDDKCPAVMNGTSEVTVIPTPAVFDLTSTETEACYGDSIKLTLSGSETGMAYFLYNSSTQVQGPVDGTDNSLDFYVKESGDYYVMAYNTSDATCDTYMNDTITIIIHDNPEITSISNSGPVCENSDVQLYSEISGGTGTYKFSWSGPASFTDTVQNPVITDIKTVEAGYYQLTVTDSYGCSSAIDSTEVIVHENPEVTASLNDTVCEYSTVYLGASPSGGTGTYDFHWTGPDNFESFIKDPTINSIALSQTGRYYITVTDGNSCFATDSTYILVNDAPVATADNDGPVCEGGGLTLSGTLAEGVAPYSYAWSLTDGTVITTNTDTTFVTILKDQAGDYIFSVVDDNGCKDSDTTTVEVNDSLKVSVTPSDVAICEKLSLQINSAVSGGITYTFSWTGPNGASGSEQNYTLSDITTADQGVYKVTVTSPECTYSVVDSSVVTVNPAPVIDTVYNNGPICEGDTLKFFSEVSGGSGSYSFNWSGPYSYSSLEQNPFIINAADTIDGDYKLILTDSYSCSDTASTYAEVNKVTATISASDGAVVCAGTPITFNGKGEDGSGNYNFDFHVVRGGTDSSVQNGTSYTWTVDTLADNDEVYVIVTDNNTLCSDQSASIFVTVNPNPIVTLAITEGNDTICSGTTVEFTSDAGYANYVYYVDGNVVQSGTDNVYRTDSLQDAQHVSVNVTSSEGCSSSTPDIIMTVYDTPVPTLTADPGTEIIEGTNVTFTAGGGTSYEFFINGQKVQDLSNDNTYECDTLKNNDVVSVNVYGDGNCVNTASLTMIVKDGIVPLDVSVTATEYCAGSGGVSIYIASPQNGVTYDLINTSDNSVVGTITYDGTNSVQWDNILGDNAGITYKVEGYYPEFPDDRVDMNNTITVIENPLPDVYSIIPTGVVTGCNDGDGYEIKLDGSDTGFSYQLQIDQSDIGASVAGTGDTISFGDYVNIGIYSVISINDVTGCVNTMDGTFEIQSDDTYTKFDVTGDGEFCEGEAGALIKLEGSEVGVEYRVQVDGADINDSWIADVTTGHTFGPYQTEGNYTIVVASDGGCTYPMNGSVNVISIPLPDAFDLNVENDGHFCEGDTIGVEISISGQQADILYNLYRDNVLVKTDTGKIDDTTLALSFGKFTTAGLYSVTAVSQGIGCEQEMYNEVMLYEDPLPTVYDVTSDGDYCAGSTTYLHLNGSEPDVQYRWERENDATVGPWVDGNGGLLDFEIFGSDTYFIVAQRKDVVTACTTEMNGRITITEKPFADLTKTLRIKDGTGDACDNGAVVIVENSEPGVVYELYKGSATGNTTDGNGGDAEFAPVVDVDATYQVMANLNGCEDFLDNDIYIDIPNVIEKFTVTGSGDICNGDPGVNFGLSGSESGVVYTLYLVDGNGAGNDKQIGDPVDGTGNALTFDIANEEGEYYVIGDNGVDCAVEMTNRVTLTVNPLPVAFTMIGSGYFCDINNGAEIGLDGQEFSVKYLLQYDDGTGSRNWAEATGGTTNDTIIFGQFIDEGLYTVIGITDKGCTSNMYGEVTVAQKPAPVNYKVLVSDTAYCSGEQGVEFIMENSEADVVYTVLDEFNIPVNETDGTGADSVSLGFFTKGIYTVIGTYGGDACETKMNDGESITVYEYETPVKFNVSSLRSNVCGSTGTTIILDGSENGRLYLLYEDGILNNDTLIGTGDTLKWAVYSAGADTISYEVVALSEGMCDLSMGTAEVIYKDSPVNVNIITENDTTEFCSGLPGIVVGLDSTEINIGYQLLDSLNNIVDFIAGTGDTAYFNNPHGENNYTVKAVDFNTGCYTIMADTLKIIENPVPEEYRMFLTRSDGSVTECEYQCTGFVNVDTIKLEMSQDFVDYLLWNDQPNQDITVIDTIRGTFDELNFGAQSEGGLFTIEGVTEKGCRAFMSGSAYIYESPLIAVNDISTLSKGELIGEIDVVANDKLLIGIDSLNEPNKNIFFKLDTSWIYLDENNVPQQFSTVGEVSINDEGKLEYRKLPSFYGRDSVRYIIYNKTHPERIDTATVFIFVGNVDLGDGETFLIPNAFSPNGDNINDKFVITGIEDKQESKLEVFNRWGTLVYRSKGQNYENDWDGKSTESSMVAAGEDLPNGTYFYVFSVKVNREGKEVNKEYSGYIELRR
ncbi:MAG: T9SS type B sorting domain-containing protein [Chlorobi bacterium]|nr:T9SS type B sorting domain-containing protein [Chlorobiota bacterium]